MSGGFEPKPGGGSLAADLDVPAPGSRSGAGMPGKTTRVDQVQAPVQRKIDPSAPGGGSDAAGAAPAATGPSAAGAAPAATGPGGTGAQPPVSRDQRIQSDLGNLAAVSSLPDVVLGAHQRSRVRPALVALSDGDFQAFVGLYTAAASATARGFLCKAVAAGSSMADVTWLAGQITGKDDNWLIDNLTLGDPRAAGNGVNQQWSMSCNASMTITLRGNYDPVFALRTRQADPNINAVNPNAGPSAAPHLAAQEQTMLQSPYAGSSHPGAQGFGGVATARNQAGGVGRWADDLLNKQSGATGMTYATTMDPSGAQAVTLLDNGLGQGMQVPCVIGNSPGAYTHYVLAMTRRAAAAGGGHDYQFHNTWDGGTSWQTGAQITGQTMTLALGTMITAVEVPTAAPAPAGPGAAGGTP
jgi:hypothetical protein